MAEKKRYPSQTPTTIRYENKAYDKVMIRLPKGTTQDIASHIGDKPVATFCKEVVLKELEELKRL